jgi:hypothetical protein
LVGWEKSCFGRRPAGMPDFLQNETGGLTAPVFLCLKVNQTSVYLHNAPLYLINYFEVWFCNSFTTV